MTIEQRTKDLRKQLMDYLDKIPGANWKEVEDIISDQLTQACAEAVDSHNATRDQRRDIEQYEKGRAKENARCRIILDKMIDKSFTEVFSEAIERAAKVAEAQKHFDDAGMIRALRPGEK